MSELPILRNPLVYRPVPAFRSRGGGLGALLVVNHLKLSLSWLS